MPSALRYGMKLESFNEPDEATEQSKVRSAKSGHPIELLVWRADRNSNYRDAQRGVYYTVSKLYASQYLDDLNTGRKDGAMQKRRLRFSKPLVSANKATALSELGETRETRFWLARYNNEPTMYGDPRPERVIAKLARSAGFDGIIYQGLNEVVEL